jgi:hypothetical protein
LSDTCDIIGELLARRIKVNVVEKGLQHIYTPSHEELQQIQEYINKEEALDSDAINRLYPSLSRDTGARILEIVAQATAEKRVDLFLLFPLSFSQINLYCGEEILSVKFIY